MPDFDMESSDSDDYNQSDEEVSNFSRALYSEARIKTLTYKWIIVFFSCKKRTLKESWNLV